jgi:hypothetical protein
VKGADRVGETDNCGRLTVTIAVVSETNKYGSQSVKPKFGSGGN